MAQNSPTVDRVANMRRAVTRRPAQRPTPTPKPTPTSTPTQPIVRPKPVVFKPAPTMVPEPPAGAPQAMPAQPVRPVMDMLHAAQAQGLNREEIMQYLATQGGVGDMASQYGLDEAGLNRFANRRAEDIAAMAAGAAPTAAPGSRPFQVLMQNEIDAARQMYAAQAAQERAQVSVQREGQENAMGLAQFQYQQQLENQMRGLGAQFGQLGTVRSGAYQQAATDAVTNNTMSQAQVMADYQNEIARLDMEMRQGIRDRRQAAFAQEQARIRAAYAMAQLGALPAAPSTGPTPPTA